MSTLHINLTYALGGIMKLNRLATVAIATAATAGLAVGLLSPANAAPKTTVAIVQSNALTGINPSVTNMNLTFNTDVAYLSGMGFTYYNNKATLVDNTAFGTYKVVSQKPYKVQYTVNKGRVWSDGTPINGIDLLLTHVVSSDAYSTIAGLGDPTDADTTPAFNSLGYGGLYEQFAVGLPILSKDKMSVTVEYSAKVPDWRLLSPGVTPVHTLVLMALEGKSKLGTAAENMAAKERFYKAFQSYDTASLKKIGAVWSKDYNINKIDSSTNPLLLVGNGPYMIKSAVANGAVTMVRNPKYNSGPKVKAINTVVFKVIGDGTAASQALKNGEIDVYAGQPTADAVAQLKAMAPAVKIIGGDQAVYEHLDIRVGPAYGTQAPYEGPFAGMSQKAKDLRTAFLLSYPRAEIIEKIIKPINPTSELMNSLMLFNAEPAYKGVIAKSGVSKYTEGTQASRTASALALVKKHYPDAAAGSGSVKIKLLFGAPSNTRRVSQSQLAKAEWAKAGFDVDVTPTSGWSSYLEDPKYDVAFFAWVKSAILQSGNVGTYETQANAQGYSNATIDKLYKELGATPLTPAQIADKYLKVDQELIKDAVTLPVFQHPSANGVTAKLMGVAPSPLSPNLVWNLWDWYFKN
jgi:peptide/nickel transport system substrate-binding protein